MHILSINFDISNIVQFALKMNYSIYRIFKGMQLLITQTKKLNGHVLLNINGLNLENM